MSTALTVVAAPPASADDGDPTFEVPFPCGEVWQGATRSAHGTGRDSHFPLDFNQGMGAQDRGATIVASATGTVVDADRYPNGRVEIDHGNGWSTLYLHLETLAVQLGDQVRGGDQVGTLGDRGSWGAFHLHYEQLRDGNPQHITFRHEPVVYDFVYTGGDYTSENCRPALRGEDGVTEGELAQWLYRLAATTAAIPAVEHAEGDDAPAAARAAGALVLGGVEAFADGSEADATVTHARFREVMRSFRHAYGQSIDEDDYTTPIEIEGDAEDPVTREAAATELYRWAGAPEVSEEDVPPYVDMPTGDARQAAWWLHDAAISRDLFADMPIGSAAYGEARWMSDHNEASGARVSFEEESFAAGETVTREQAASLVARVAASSREQTDTTVPGFDDPRSTVAQASPTDALTRSALASALHELAEAPPLLVRRPSIYVDAPLDLPAEEAIQWLTVEGIVTPTADSTFQPEAAVTREYMAMVLYRFAAYLEERSGD